MSTTNKKLKFSKVDVLPDQEFDPRQVKVRISIMLDGDILDAARTIATKHRMRYQTLINKTLRQALVDDAEWLGIESIERRIKALEEEVGLIRVRGQKTVGRKVA